MSRRSAFLSSTFLAGFAVGLFATGAVAGPVLPSTRAVDGVNGKVEGFGGAYATKGLYGGAGSLSVPLTDSYGLQIDGAAGSFSNRFIGSIGGHLFWRDPSRGLVGLYGDYAHWDEYGGVHVSHVGGEGEAYFGRWTLGGVAGVEFGNNSSVLTSSSSTVAIAGGGTLTTTTTTGSLDNVTRFFDRVTLSYYITDNWKASIGHRYYGGKNALALGTEYALPVGRGAMASLFAEGRVGEGHNNYGVWGGIRFYFGQHDKSLIRRNREDDPAGDNGSVDSLFSIADSLGGSSPSATASCPPGEVYMGGACVGIPSDRRFKRDIALLARLDNGIGLYRYRYLWSETVYVGVMAQEVVDIVPDAVNVAADGYYRVDYARLGLRLLTWDEWVGCEAAGLPRAA